MEWTFISSVAKVGSDLCRPTRKGVTKTKHVIRARQHMHPQNNGGVVRVVSDTGCERIHKEQRANGAESKGFLVLLSQERDGAGCRDVHQRQPRRLGLWAFIR